MLRQEPYVDKVFDIGNVCIDWYQRHSANHGPAERCYSHRCGLSSALDQTVLLIWPDIEQGYGPFISTSPTQSPMSGIRIATDRRARNLK